MIKRSLISICFSVLFFPFGIFLQATCTLSAQDISFKHISRGDAFSQRSIGCIIQDHFGFMWFGTSDGLNRYDGYGFEFFRSDPKDSSSLSDSFVNCLFEDRNNQIWVGTGNGLNLYNSKTQTFTVYKSNPLDSLSLSNNIIYSINEDSSGLLWIGTFGGGLNIFDPETKKFTVLKNIPKDPFSLSSDFIRTIYKDHSGQMWIGTSGGLNLFNAKNKTFTVFKNNPNDSGSLSHNYAYSICEDRSGRLWIGTYGGGLNLFDPKTKKFSSFRNDPQKISSLSNDLVQTIFEDRYGRLWIGTRDGLNIFNEKNKTFRIFRNNPLDPGSISDNIIFSIYEDRSGKLWVGTYNVDGLNFYDAKMKEFGVFTINAADAFSLSGDNVFALLKDKSDRLWIGTENGGLKLYHSELKTFSSFKNNPKIPSSISSNNVSALYEDHSGEIWVGTNNSGLNHFDPKEMKFISFKNDPKNRESISDNSIHAIFEDHSGQFWVGTNGGLNLFDRNTKKFTSFKNDPKDSTSLLHNSVTSIYEDQSNQLWIGTSGGLNRYNPKTKSFRVFRTVSGDTVSLGNQFVMSIYQDRSGNLWIGEFDGGLNLYNPKTETFRVFREEQGLPNNAIYGILEDDKGRLWLSTNKGISRFDPKTGIFRNYDVTDGLPNNEFNQGAYIKDKDGKMFFGVFNAVCFFYPDSIKDDSYIPPIVLTGLEIFNKSISPGKNYNGFILPQSITETDELILTYRESVFTLAFSILNFAQQMKNKYAYRLDGFDQEWNYTNAKRRFATYTNLDPGTYTFHVKGSNHDGIWNEKGRTLKIIILPPFWKTWWAYIIYTLIFTVLLAGFIQLKINKTKSRSLQIIKKQQEEARIKEAELRVKVAEFQAKSQQDEIENAKKVAVMNLELSQKNQQLKILNDKKNEYLGFAAHDLRTPLSGIIGYAELLISDLDTENIDKKEMKQSLEIIHKVSNDMSLFISQILDIASIESGKVHLEKRFENLEKIIFNVIRLYSRKAELKNIQLTVDTFNGLPPVRVDQSKIEAVIENLISNAIKYTSSGGSIHIYGEHVNSEIQIHIEDNGQGLNSEDLEKVFSSFTKLSARPTAGESSTGLGLAIVKKIVEIHGGRVWVKSKKDFGSTFSFSVPTE